MATIEDGWRALDDLRPNSINYNEHTREGVVERMAARIRCNAFTAPFIVTPDGTILGGHLRRLGLLKLRSDSYSEPEGIREGWQVPVRVFTGNEVQERAILVGDNPAMDDLSYDNEALAALLADLQREGALEGAGYSDEALDRLIGELAAQEPPPGGGLLDGVDPDALPEEVEARCEAGDLWSLGRHKLLCGDSTRQQDYDRLLDGETPCGVLTDPPYGVGVDYDTFADDAADVARLIKAFLPIVRKWEPVLLTPGTPRVWDYPPATWLLAWVHPAPMSSGPWGFNGLNPVLAYGADPYLKAGKGRRPDHCVMVADREGVTGHPTPKPVKVWSWMMERMSLNEGDLVLDPFLGSGTTLIAAETLNRTCYGIELSPHYCDVILARYEKTTGKTAELLQRHQPELREAA